MSNDQDTPSHQRRSSVSREDGVDQDFFKLRKSLDVKPQRQEMAQKVGQTILRGLKPLLMWCWRGVLGLFSSGKTAAGAQQAPMMGAHQAAPNAGSQSWSPRRPMVTGFVALAVLILGFGAWSAVASISGAVVASGTIVVKGDRQAVQHTTGGLVGEILVDEGDTVSAGDTLLRLDDSVSLSELTIIEGQLFEIMAQLGRLKAERDGKDTIAFSTDLLALADGRPEVAEVMVGQAGLFAARRDTMQGQREQLTERKIQIDNQIEGTSAQLASLREQKDLVELELKEMQGLFDQGLTQMSLVTGLQREKARIEGQVGELVAQTAQLRGQITEIELNILSLETTVREEAITQLRDLQYREIELRERRLSTMTALSRLDVRAPVSGVVYDRKINTIGAVILPADEIMSIVPAEAPLVISTRIQPINVDEINIGQEAALRFAAFDQRTTPEIYGAVAKISPDAFIDEVNGFPYYEVEILPYEGEIERLGAVELVPGMPVDAFITTGERSPFNYLTKPLADYFNKAFRET